MDTIFFDFIEGIISVLIPVAALYLAALQMRDEHFTRALALAWFFAFLLSLQFLKYLVMGGYSRLDAFVFGGILGLLGFVEFLNAKPKEPDRYTLALSKKIKPWLSSLSKKLDLSEDLIALMIILVLSLRLMCFIAYKLKRL